MVDVGSTVHAGGGAILGGATNGAGNKGSSVHPCMEGAGDDSPQTAGGALIAR
jgi:hypothetical protein